MKRTGIPVVVILLSGRPMILEDALVQADAFLATWLPRTEGEGVADVLFGDYKPTGKLSADEGIFDITADGLAKLKPVKPNGTVTFGGQTHPADGNAGMIVTNQECAAQLARDKSVEVQLLGFGQARVEKGYMPTAPVPAAHAALQQRGSRLRTLMQ